jgi:hypothetical protein
MASTSTSCTSRIDRLGLAPGQQVGGDQGGIVAVLPLNAGNQRVGGRVGQLVEPALERGGRCFGVEPGGGDAFVAEETLWRSVISMPPASSRVATVCRSRWR